MSQTLQNKIMMSKSMNGIITLSDGVATLENGNLTNVNNIQTDSLNTNSFATNDFSVSTNIDLTGDTSKLQFTYDPSSTAFIDRNSINFKYASINTDYDPSYNLDVTGATRINNFDSNYSLIEQNGEASGVTEDIVAIRRTSASVGGNPSIGWIEERDLICDDGYGIKYTKRQVWYWSPSDGMYFMLTETNSQTTTFWAYNISTNSLSVGQFTTQSIIMNGAYSYIQQDPATTNYQNYLCSSIINANSTFPFNVLTLQDTAGGSSTSANGGNLTLKRTKNKPNAGDELFNLLWTGGIWQGTSTSTTTYAYITGAVANPDLYIPSGRLRFRVKLSNVMTDCLTIDPSGVSVASTIDLNCNNINLTNINGSPYVAGGSQTLAQTLGYGNSAGTYNIDMSGNSILNNLNLTSTGTNILKQIQSYPPTLTPTQATTNQFTCIGYNNLSTLSTSSGNNQSVVIGNLNLTDTTTMNTFVGNAIIGRNNINNDTLSNTNLLQYNNIYGSNNFSSSTTPTTITYNNINGYSNFGGASDATTFSHNVVNGNLNTFLSTTSSVTNNTILGYQNTMNGAMANSVVLGNNNQVAGSNSITIGNNLTNANSSTMVLGGTNGTDPLNIDMRGYLTFDNGICGNASYVAFTGNTTLTKNNFGISTYIYSSTGNYIITVPNPSLASSAGAVMEIRNMSTANLNMYTPSGSWDGQYGNGTTTQILNNGQTMVILCVNAGWKVIRIEGVKFAAMYRLTTTQQISSGTITNVVPATIVSQGWNGKKLSYGSGVWTNNTGFSLNLAINVNITWANNVNSSTNATTLNSNGLRSMWLLHSNVVTYPKFVGTNNINVFTDSTGVSQYQITQLYQNVATQILLQNGENFRIQCYHTNSITYTNTSLYLISTTQLDAVNVMITLL